MHVQPSLADRHPSSFPRFDARIAALAVIAAAAASGALEARWSYSLGVDEPFTALAVAQPLSTLLETLRHDNTPVTYIALKLWSWAAGSSEVALRLFMAASYAIAVFVVGLAGMTLGGMRCGLLAAVLVGSSGRVGLLHAATVRPYALLTLFSAVTVYLLVTAARHPSSVSWRRIAALTIVQLLGLFTHPIFVFVAVGSAAAVSLTVGSRGRALAMSGIVAVAIYFAAWGWMVRATIALPATAWLAAPDFIDLWNAYLGLWGNRNGVLLAGAALAVLTLPGAARRLLHDDAVRMLVLIAAFAFAGPFLVSYIKPVFHTARTPMLSLPFIALAAASVVAILGSRALVAILAGCFLLGAAQYVIGSRRSGDPEPTRESLATVLARARCGDVLLSAGLPYAPVRYYLGRIDAPTCIAHEVFPADVASHPGWVDSATIAQYLPTYEAEAAALSARLAESNRRVFVFAKSRGTGADVTKLLERPLTSRLRVEETLPLRGAFFDQVIVFVSW